MHWVFSLTMSVTFHQLPDMLPGPFPAWLSCGWWLRAEEVGAAQAWQCCALLTDSPLLHGCDISCLGLLILQFEFLQVIPFCPVFGWCYVFFTQFLREAVAVTALSTAGGWSHHTGQASPSHTPCSCPKHSSAVSLLVSPPCPQLVLTFSETWLSMTPSHHFKMCVTALRKIVRERD